MSIPDSRADLHCIFRAHIELFKEGLFTHWALIVESQEPILQALSVKHVAALKGVDWVLLADLVKTNRTNRHISTPSDIRVALADEN